MAKEGKVLEQKKLLQPLLGTPEGIHSSCIIIFSTSAPSAVYPNAEAECSSSSQSLEMLQSLTDAYTLGCFINDTLQKKKDAIPVRTPHGCI